METESGDAGAQECDKAESYSIRVRGKLEESWSDWLSDMTVTVALAGDGTPITALTGSVADQAALRGILNRLWDLNLTVISVVPVDRKKQ